MLFNSLEFYIFLVALLVICAWLAPRWRWLLLLGASLVFYGSFGIANLLYLAAVIAIAYLCGLAMGEARPAGQRRMALVAGLVAILGGLAALKFHDFLAGELEALLIGISGASTPITLPRLGLTAPPGFSFYAFMAAAYVIDAYRQPAAVETNGGLFALHLAWFPKILAGPIERAGALLPQLASGFRMEPALFVLGLQLVGLGLIKKVVIADNLATVVDATFRIAAYASPMELLVASYFFAFQIYCDFSGYSDIAIGISLMFGIRLVENFRRPYLSASTAEFWSSRWHISLGKWFRDYLYFPLGGSRAGVLRQYANLMIVFLVSGLWHAGMGYGVGWTFLVWGALNGAYQWLELAVDKLRTRLSTILPSLARLRLPTIVKILLTFHLVLVSWVFFRAASVEQAWLVITKIARALPGLPALALKYPFSTAHMTGAILILCLVAFEILDERRPIADRLAVLPTALRWSLYYAGLASLLVLGQWQSSTFIYMQF